MLPAAVPSGLWLLGIRYFVLDVRPPAHWRASTHFSEISRLRLASGRGRDIASTSVRSKWFSHSTPWVSGSSAAIFARSSAFSLPPTPLCAGHHRISIMIPGLALRSAAMCFRTWRAYCCPGPGSPDAMAV